MAELLENPLQKYMNMPTPPKANNPLEKYVSMSPSILSSEFETKLNPDEEKEFQQWKKVNAPLDSGLDYDYRGAFKAGATKSVNGHWVDTFKKPNHPTFSIESIYAKYRPDLAGHWEGEEYIPSPTRQQERERKFIAGDPMLRLLNKSLGKGYKPLFGSVLQDVPRAIKEESEKAEPLGALKVLGNALSRVEPETQAAFIKMSKGGWKGADVLDKESFSSEVLQYAQLSSNYYRQKALQDYGEKNILPFIPIKLTDVAELPENMAYSLASMGSGLAIGAPLAFVPVPGARVAAYLIGSAASGKAAYEMSTYSIMQSFLEYVNEQSIKEKGREITASEQDKLKKEFGDLAHKYGLWEAGPEAVSNLAFASVIGGPLEVVMSKMGMGKGTTQVLGKLVSLYGEETLTEMVTQWKQARIEEQMGLRAPGEGQISWGKALQEVAPQTFLLSTILGGLGMTAVEAKRRLTTSLRKEVGVEQSQELADLLNQSINDNKSFKEQVDEEAVKNGHSVEEIIMKQFGDDVSPDDPSKPPIPRRANTPFGKLIEEQMLAGENVPLHPPEEGRLAEEQRGIEKNPLQKYMDMEVIPETGITKVPEEQIVKELPKEDKEFLEKDTNVIQASRAKEVFKKKETKNKISKAQEVFTQKKLDEAVQGLREDLGKKEVQEPKAEKEIAGIKTDKELLDSGYTDIIRADAVQSLQKSLRPLSEKAVSPKEDILKQIGIEPKQSKGIKEPVQEKILLSGFKLRNEGAYWVVYNPLDSVVGKDKTLEGAYKIAAELEKYMVNKPFKPSTVEPKGKPLSKAQILFKIDEALKTAPKDNFKGNKTINFQIDGGVKIENTKKALEFFKKKVNKAPANIFGKETKATEKFVDNVEKSKGIVEPEGIDKFNLGEAIKDIGDALGGEEGSTSLSPEGQKKQQEARRKLLEKHLPALIREAQKQGKELGEYFSTLGLTPKQIDELLRLSKLATTPGMPPPDKIVLAYHADEEGVREGISYQKPPGNDFKIPSVEEQKAKMQETAKKVNDKFDPDKDSVILAMVDALMSRIKEIRGVRIKQKELFAKERARRIPMMIAAREKAGGGEAGAIASRKALAGELPKAVFDGFRKAFTEKNVSYLFNLIAKSPYITEYEKITANEGLEKLLDGTAVPQDVEIRLLSRVFGTKFTEAMLDTQDDFQKFRRAMGEVLNIPRAIMAAGDLSGLGRQGYLLSLRYPDLALKAFFEQVKYFNSKEYFDAAQEAIYNHPLYQFSRDAGLYIAGMSHFAQEREESYSRVPFAEKYIPFVLRSERAYIGVLNYLRFNSFLKMVEKADGAKLETKVEVPISVKNQETGTTTQKMILYPTELTKAIADLINTASGRASLGKFESSATALNTFLFSPRLWASRLKMVNPLYHIKTPLAYTQLPDFVRKEANRIMLNYLGMTSLMLFLGSLAGGEAGWDWTSADFGKLKIGKTRIDLMGGYQQPVRLLAQILSGFQTSSKTGKRTELNKTLYGRTMKDVLYEYGEYKEAPLFSLLTEALSKPKRGKYRFMAPSKFWKDFAGINVPTPIAERFTYMFMQDMFDVIQEDPELAPLGLLSMLGISVQTY